MCRIFAFLDQCTTSSKSAASKRPCLQYSPHCLILTEVRSIYALLYASYCYIVYATLLHVAIILLFMMCTCVHIIITLDVRKFYLHIFMSFLRAYYYTCRLSTPFRHRTTLELLTNSSVRFPEEGNWYSKVFEQLHHRQQRSNYSIIHSNTAHACRDYYSYSNNEYF